MMIINPIEYNGWDSLILFSKNYSFFHSTAWAKILQYSYHYKPVYFTQIEDGKIQFLIALMEINHLKNILFKLKKKLQKNSFKNTIKKFILMTL